MLILRYLLKETLKSQLAVFFVLMAIFVTQRFVRVLAEASNGDIPAGLVLGFLALKMPVLAALILPLSVFLGIMLAHGRLYVDSEMTVMRACGVSEWYVARVMLLLSVFMAGITAILTLWLAPMAMETEYNLEQQLASESGLSALLPGRFEETANKQAVLFVQDIDSNNQLQNVFVAQHDPDNASEQVHIVYSSGGFVREAPDGSQKLVLTDGLQYEGKHGQRDYRVVQFEEYQVQIAEEQAEQKRRKLESYSTAQLMDEDSIGAIAEFQWRIAIPLSIPFLVLIAVPLSAVDPRQGRFGKLFPGIMLYLGYFMLLMAGRKVLEDGKIPPTLGLWWVHSVILMIGITLIVKGRTTGVKMISQLKGLVRV
ncbi:MAG: LPS export ABC transporter permease LptF [Aestuariibacter sp.]